MSNKNEWADGRVFKEDEIASVIAHTEKEVVLLDELTGEIYYLSFTTPKAFELYTIIEKDVLEKLENANEEERQRIEKVLENFS